MNAWINVPAFSIYNTGCNLDIFEMEECSFTNARNVAIPRKDCYQIARLGS